MRIAASMKHNIVMTSMKELRARWFNVRSRIAFSKYSRRDLDRNADSVVCEHHDVQPRENDASRYLETVGMLDITCTDNST
jgi:hypothetical protein